MIFRFLRGAWRLHPRRQLAMMAAVAMGALLTATLGAVSLQFRDRLAHALRRFGANIIIEPLPTATSAGVSVGSDFLEVADLQRALTTFWRNNIVGLAPVLTVGATIIPTEGNGKVDISLLGAWFRRDVVRPGQSERMRAGLLPLFPEWRLEGRAPKEGEDRHVVLGRALAEKLQARLGSRIAIAVGEEREQVEVVGILSTGGYEEDEALVNLELAQRLGRLEGKVGRILVSAVTVPSDAFERMDAATMTPEQIETRMCTPYISSITSGLERAIPLSRARRVWNIAEAESLIMTRLDGLIAILTLVTLASAALSMTSSFTARILGRRSEIALLRSIGASSGQVAILLGAEALGVALVGGALGTALTPLLLTKLGAAFFNVDFHATGEVFLLALGGSLVIAAVGSIAPIRLALKVAPAVELRRAE